jgi:hypothetical protein
MFHAPNTDSKQQADSTKAEPSTREQDWQPAFDGSHALGLPPIGGGGLPPPAPPALRSQQLARLQRAYGNQAVLRMLERSRPAIQPKLVVNEPGDAYEQEADRVAEQVMRMPAPELSIAAAPPQLSRKCAACEEEEAKPLQTKPAGTFEAAAGEAPGIVHDVLRSPGQPLEAPTRAFFELRFGHDFSHVRVHADDRAAASTRAVDALAYTVGSDIVFGSNRYAPNTDSGRHLLAHELTHVLQQRQIESAVIARQPAPDAGAPDAGAAPDAGTVNPVAPDAGAGAGAAPPPGSAPAASAVTVTGLQVDNPTASITFDVPSNLGAAGRHHAVSVASIGATPTIVRAVVSPAVAAGDPSLAGLAWTINGTPATPGADPLQVPVERSAGKRVVGASLGASSAEITVWSVFARIASAPGAISAVDDGATLALGATIAFTASILPKSIVTDADRPALDGANTVPPPGGSNSCGSLLAGGADHRWDMSRQIRRRAIDPAALSAGFATNPRMPACLLTDIPAFPTNNVLGNDDASTVDETNDPYASAGSLTSNDTPTRVLTHTVGADGNTFEQHIQFHEFGRLENRATWWTFSQFAPWRVHIRARRIGGKWVDNGTDIALDNSGF